jgi:hypothetical protein
VSAGVFRVQVHLAGAALQPEADERPFEYDCEELARVLRTLASKVERGSTSGPLADVNGNTVGQYRIDRALS